MEKVAVIGSNSFLGSNFINAVLENTNHRVIGISRSREYNPIFLPYKGKEGNRFTFYQKDLNNDLEDLLDLFKKEKINYITNYAAQGMVGQSWKNPEQWFKTNCLSIVNLTNKLRRLDSLKKYVHISTNEVYGSCNNIDENTLLNPTTPYATSKASADLFIKNLVNQFNFPANIIRPTNVYGPGQQLFRIIPRSIIYTKINKKLQLQGGGKAIKSYLHVKDNSKATLKIMESGTLGEIYNLSPDSGISIESIVKKICKNLGKDFNKLVEIVGERIGQDLEYTLNSNKARKEFNWKPNIGFDEGIEQCINWVNQNWEIIQNQPLEYIHKE